MLKYFLSILLFKNILSKNTNILGNNGVKCYSDGGYAWCETIQKCIRPWEETCPTINPNIDYITEYCDNSNVQTCNQVCDIPICDNNKCAIRIDNCCNYICSTSSVSCDICEEPPICTDAPIGCQYIPPIPDNCGCINTCGTIDCSYNLSNEGELCGYYSQDINNYRSCIDGLECVNTFGPAVADAPGRCYYPCNYIRDTYGHCITDGCSQWFDGCNICFLINGIIQNCRQDNICNELGVSHCLDDINENNNGIIQSSDEIPWNCVTWFDGCNTCTVKDGILSICTLMLCFRNIQPYCMAYDTRPLKQGDICYRFCEDGSQTTINRMDGCPINTHCKQDNPDIISFDTCSNSALKCISGH